MLLRATRLYVKWRPLKPKFERRKQFKLNRVRKRYYTTIEAEAFIKEELSQFTPDTIRENIMTGATYFVHHVYSYRRKTLTDSYRPGNVYLDDNIFEDSLKGTIVSFFENERLKIGILDNKYSKRMWKVKDIDGHDRIVHRSDILYQWPNPEIPIDVSKVKITFKSPYKDCTVEQGRRVKNYSYTLLKSIPNDIADKIWETFYPMCVSGTAHSASLDLYAVGMAIFGPKPITDLNLFTTFLFLMKHPDKFVLTDRGFFCNRIALVSSKNKDPVQVRAAGLAQKLETLLNEEISLSHLLPYIKLLDSMSTAIVHNRIQSECNDMTFSMDDLDLMKRLFDYSTFKDSLQDLPEIFDTLLTPLGYGHDPHHVFKLFQDLGIFGVDDNIHILNWPYEFKFNEALGKDVIYSSQRGIEEQDRIDFSRHQLFAFTQGSTDTIENAVSIVNEEDQDWIYFHIPDVPYHVSPDSHLDLAARDRALGIKLPNVHSSIYPPDLLDYMSFVPGTKKKAISIGVLLNSDGSIDRYKVLKTEVEKITHMTIDELTGAIKANANEENSNISELFSLILQKIEQIAQTRLLYRLNNSAIITSTPTPDIQSTLTEDGKQQLYIKAAGYPNQGGTKILNELSLLAGEAAAKFCNSKRTPIIYESQQVIRENVVTRSGKGQNYLSYINSLYSLKSKHFGTKPQKHDSYGLTCYTSIAKPLTRYMDVMTLYQIKKAVEDNRPVFGESYIESKIQLIRRMEEKVEKLTGKLKRHSTIEYIKELLEDDPDQVFKLVITHPKSIFNPEAMGVLLDLGILANVQTKRKLKQGDVIDVKVERIQSFYDILLLKDVGKVKAKKSGESHRDKTDA